MTEYLTTKQAAARLGICKRHVARLIAEGRLPAIKPGHDWLISVDDLDSLVRKPVGRPAGSPDSKPRQRREKED